MENISTEQAPKQDLHNRSVLLFNPLTWKKKIILSITILLLLFSTISVIENYFQYQKIGHLNNQESTLTEEKQGLKKQNMVLQDQIASLSANLTDLNNTAKKYLYLQGKQCDGDPAVCLNNLINKEEKKPVIAIATGGFCLIRNGISSIPSTSDPDVGTGYAKMTKVGVNTLTELQKACNQNDYTQLMQSYCAENQSPAQFEVAVVNKFGGVETTGCSSFGCGAVSCPRG